MPRLEVELTSIRPDGTWTWRKAGARQPKGEAVGSLLPPGAQTGDVLRVEVDTLLDGVEITAVLPPKAAKTDRFERIQLKGRPISDDQLVSTTLAPKGRGDRKGDRDGRRRRDRDGERTGERSGGRPPRERSFRTERPAPPERPKPKRIRPLRRNRDQVLESLAPELRPIAEQVLKGGVPAVRQAIEVQNTQLRADGRPEVAGDELLALAERLLPQLRTAEWLDRAESAQRIIEEVDLRDLRSVVVAADGLRDESVRELAQTLKDALSRRVEAEHALWLAELAELLTQERVVRALRVSSRPPKAGVPLPPELAAKLIEQAAAAMTSETNAERWSMVLDALSFSPIRGSVTPQSLPAEPSEEILSAVRSVADRLPQIATAFGIDPASVPKSAKRRPAARKPNAAGGRPAKAGAKPAPQPAPPAPEATETEATETEAPEAGVTEVADTPVVAAEAPAAEPVVEAEVAEAVEAPAAEAELAEAESAVAEAEPVVEAAESVESEAEPVVDAAESVEQVEQVDGE